MDIVNDMQEEGRTIWCFRVVRDESENFHSMLSSLRLLCLEFLHPG